MEIVKAIPQIITGIVDAFGSYFGKMAEVGGNLLKGLWQGISDAGAWLWNQISGFFGGIVDGIKDFFGIHSPSKLFANLGGFMAEGLGEGFGDEMKDVSKSMQNAIPSDFDLDMNGTVSGFNGVQAQAFDITIPLSICLLYTSARALPKPEMNQRTSPIPSGKPPTQARTLTES